MDVQNAAEKAEQRCECGKLLFKRAKRGIEFKCTRCKRIHLIPFDRIDTEYHTLCPIVDQSDPGTLEARGQEPNALAKKGES